MLREGNAAELREFCEALHPARTAEFMEGLSVDETARTLRVSARTVDLDWTFARAWLYEELGRDD